MIKEFLCGINASVIGIKKQPTNETVGSEVCLVDTFTKSKSKACTGVCLKCKCRVTSGVFSPESRINVGPKGQEDDTWHL